MKRARQRKRDSYERWINLSVWCRYTNTSKELTGRRTLKNFRDYHQESNLLKAKYGWSCCSKRDRLTSQNEDSEFLLSSSSVYPSSLWPWCWLWTGSPSVDKKTQCALLSEEFDFQHISLDDVLSEKSNDQKYSHIEFVKDCLREHVVVPTGLAISLLERKINEGIKEGKSWILVRGFPESMQQLLELEEKISITYVDRALLTSVGAKNKLHTVSELLNRGNAPACRKAGTIFRWS